MDGGLHGLLDFAGYPIGAGAAVVPPGPPCGFHGLIDFVGYPCGGGAKVPRGHVKVAGRHAMVQAVLAQMQSQLSRRQEFAKRQDAMVKQTLVRRMQYEADLSRYREHLEQVTYSVVLAEL